MALVDERKIDVMVYLHENGPDTGYAIAADDGIEYTKGYIYDVLGELEGEDMVEVVDRESEGRKRVLYQLTENGRLLLKALDRIDP